MSSLLSSATTTTTQNMTKTSAIFWNNMLLMYHQMVLTKWIGPHCLFMANALTHQTLVKRTAHSHTYTHTHQHTQDNMQQHSWMGQTKNLQQISHSSRTHLIWWHGLGSIYCLHHKNTIRVLFKRNFNWWIGSQW